MFRIALCTPPEYKYYKRFVAVCGCGSTDHAQHIDISVDDDYGIDMEIYSDAWVHVEWKWGWKAAYYSIKKRIMLALRILFTGHIRMQNGFIFDREEQIDDYLNALTNAKKELQINAAKKREAKEAKENSI